MNCQFCCVRLSSVLHEPSFDPLQFICYNFTTFSLKKRPFVTNRKTSFSHIKNYILPNIIFLFLNVLCIISVKKTLYKLSLLSAFSMVRRSCAYVCDSVGAALQRAPQTEAGSGMLQRPCAPQGGGDGCGEWSCRTW